MLAALASAAMPSIVMAGVRDSERANDTDDAAGIDQAVMQDAAGRMYDIYACDTEDGRKRLTGRVQAARTLERAKDPGGLGFALDTVLAFVDGKEKSTLTGGATVMVAAHNDGVARPSICLLWMIARRWARPSAPFTGCGRISCRPNRIRYSPPGRFAPS